MTAEAAAVTAALITQDVDVTSTVNTTSPCDTSPTSAHPALETTPVPSPPKRKPNSSRRGKQYKCGHCHELGHNQKTCPRRQASAEVAAASAIQPLGVETDLFGTQTGLTHPHAQNGHALPYRTVSLCKLDAAVEAANKRVAMFEKQVVNAESDQEFLEATLAMEKAVAVYEKVASCAQRCAIIAHGFSMQGWTTEQQDGRESKRMRLETPQTPSGVIQVVVPTGPNGDADASDVVDQESVEVQDVKEEGLE